MKSILIAVVFLFFGCLTPELSAATHHHHHSKSSQTSHHKGTSHRAESELLYNPPWPSNFTTVVIDPGHGGHDYGGIPGQRIPEKTMALDVALRLRPKLQAAGVHTVLTRSTDTFVSLPDRAAIANAQTDAIFVSIHFNATPRAGAHGVETYYFVPSAARLAQRLQARLSTAQSMEENRGVKRRGFYVLRKTRIPSVLVEPAFLTNPDEGREVLQSAFRQRLADLIARAILESRSY